MRALIVSLCYMGSSVLQKNQAKQNKQVNKVSLPFWKFQDKLNPCSLLTYIFFAIQIQDQTSAVVWIQEAMHFMSFQILQKSPTQPGPLHVVEVVRYICERKDLKWSRFSSKVFCYVKGKP